MDDSDLITGWLTLVLGEATRLRAAGVTSIGAAGCTVTFAPPDPVAVSGAVDKPDATVAPEGLDALNDPHSYPGGIVPGYQIEHFDRGEP